MIEHNRRICGYHNRAEQLHVIGTPEQIGLLLEICDSLVRGTLIQDMRVVVGTGLDPTVVTDPSNARQGVPTVWTTPSTTPTPTPHSTGKSGALDDAVGDAGGGSQPDSGAYPLGGGEKPGTAGADPFSGEGTL